uniref:Uncharacterized protein n=1 Tax=Siphoviridae sp. ctXQq5 TaxID=2826368 RepID=A0A8S5N0L1_9CAUD|nr:MAG TPA: hypothetical protein [Siphoviridae sp. ctXQq5]
MVTKFGYKKIGFVTFSLCGQISTESYKVH